MVIYPSVPIMVALLRVDQDASGAALAAERLRLPSYCSSPPTLHSTVVVMQDSQAPACSSHCLGERAASVPITAFLMAPPGHPDLFKSCAESSPPPFGIHNSQRLDIDVF